MWQAKGRIPLKAPNTEGGRCTGTHLKQVICNTMRATSRVRSRSTDLPTYIPTHRRPKTVTRTPSYDHSPHPCLAPLIGPPSLWLPGPPSLLPSFFLLPNAHLGTLVTHWPPAKPHRTNSKRVVCVGTDVPYNKPTEWRNVARSLYRDVKAPKRGRGIGESNGG